MSTTISANQVKELRDQTGAGMMDCKRALQETGGVISDVMTNCRDRSSCSRREAGGRGVGLMSCPVGLAPRGAGEGEAAYINRSEPRHQMGVGGGRAFLDRARSHR